MDLSGTTGRQRSRLWSLACALVLALAGVWAAPVAAQDTGFVFPVMLVPQEGGEAAYVIVEQVRQEVVSLSGLFEMVAPFEERFERRAVRAHYTVLSADDGKARLLVRAQPIDPETRKPVSPVRWEAVYIITHDGVYQERPVVISPDYLDLVEPSWLTDWSAASYADLPQKQVRPGESWKVPFRADLTDLFLGGVTPVLNGRFAGWEERPGATGLVAHLAEDLEGSTTQREEVFENVYMDQVIDLTVGVDHWLIPGGFPYGVERSVQVVTHAVIGPETGAPIGFGGALEVIFHMGQSFEIDLQSDAVWLD